MPCRREVGRQKLVQKKTSNRSGFEANYLGHLVHGTNQNFSIGLLYVPANKKFHFIRKKYRIFFLPDSGMVFYLFSGLVACGVKLSTVRFNLVVAE